MNTVIIDFDGSGSPGSVESGREDSNPDSDTSSGFSMDLEDSSYSSLEVGLFHDQTPANELQRKICHLKRKFHRYFHRMLRLKVVKDDLLRRVVDLEVEHVVLHRRVIQLKDRFGPPGHSRPPGNHPLRSPIFSFFMPFFFCCFWLFFNKKNLSLIKGLCC